MYQELPIYPHVLLQGMEEKSINMEIKEAQRALYDSIKEHDDVTGASSNDVEIKIMLIKKSKSVMKIIPKTYEGFKVIVDVTGVIRPLRATL
jgi:SepF-like predicted cell division protein (DUF552 family)